jgi:hypothetical protein
MGLTKVRCLHVPQHAVSEIPPPTTSIALPLHSRQTGLPEMVGSHEGQKVTLNRENGRDRPKQSCYYAAL